MLHVVIDVIFNLHRGDTRLYRAKSGLHTGIGIVVVKFLLYIITYAADNAALSKFRGDLSIVIRGILRNYMPTILTYNGICRQTQKETIVTYFFCDRSAIISQVAISAYTPIGVVTTWIDRNAMLIDKFKISPRDLLDLKCSRSRSHGIDYGLE